jgi:TDG/mug DNA glycosylase family protein
MKTGATIQRTAPQRAAMQNVPEQRPIRRLAPDQPFPAYSYVPGRFPHPQSDPRGHSFGVKTQRPDPLDPDQWHRCRPYLYGIDLFNHGYYWEAHEVWEGLWHACGRTGKTACFLKGLIKLAAAGVKAREGIPQGVKNHALRAADVFRQTADEIGGEDCRYLGLRLGDLIGFAQDLAVSPIPYEEGNRGTVKPVFDFILFPAQAEQDVTQAWRPTREQLAAAHRKTVPDVIAPSLKVLFCGINPGLYSAAVGHHFARPGNRFWPTLHAAGFTERLLSPFEESELLQNGYGITNIVNRATGAADELSTEELIEGGRRLKRKVLHYRPAIVAFVGVGAYRIAFNRPRATVGRQSEKIGSSGVWLLPNPSGLNAHYGLPELARLFAELRLAVEQSAF